MDDTNTHYSVLAELLGNAQGYNFLTFRGLSFYSLPLHGPHAEWCKTPLVKRK